MKKSLLLSLTIALLMFVSWNVYAQKKQSKVTWEYKIVQVSSEYQLNELGAQGWELVSYEGIEQGSLIMNCVLKRVK